MQELFATSYKLRLEMFTKLKLVHYDCSLDARKITTKLCKKLCKKKQNVRLNICWKGIYDLWLLISFPVINF